MILKNLFPESPPSEEEIGQRMSPEASELVSTKTGPLPQRSKSSISLTLLAMETNITEVAEILILKVAPKD
jgi:hypothetical protein